MPANLIVPLEMGDSGVLSATGAAVTSLHMQVTLDPADYDGATYYFECVASNSSGGALDVTLYNFTSSGAAVAVSIANAADTVRYRSAAFTPATGANNYRVQLPQTAGGAGQLTVYSARIIVVQVGATITRIQIPMMGYQFPANDRTDVYGSYIDQNYDDVYGIGYYTRHGIFLKTAANWSTIAAGTPWTLEVMMCGNNASGTNYAALYNKTDNAAVTGTELTTTQSSTPTMCTCDFADNATNFHDGDQFEVRFKHSSNQVNIFYARLYVRLTSLLKGEVYYRVGMGRNSAKTASTFNYPRILFDHTSYSSPVLYLEVTGVCSDNAEIFTLWDASTSDSSSSGSSLTNGVNFNSSTRARIRSSAITLPTSGHRLLLRQVATTNNGFHVNAFALVLFTGTAAGINTQVNIGDAWKAATAAQINIGNAWKPVTNIQQNIGNTWKVVK